MVEVNACAALSSSLMTRHLALPSVAGGAQAMPLMSVARLPRRPSTPRSLRNCGPERVRPPAARRQARRGSARQSRGRGDAGARTWSLLIGQDAPQRWRVVGGSGIHGPDLVRQFWIIEDRRLSFFVDVHPAMPVVGDKMRGSYAARYTADYAVGFWSAYGEIEKKSARAATQRCRYVWA